MGIPYLLNSIFERWDKVEKFAGKVIGPILILVILAWICIVIYNNYNKSAERGTESESAKSVNPWANTDGTLNAEGRKQMEQLHRDFRNIGDAQLSEADKAIRLNPNDADAYLKRGAAYTTLNQPQRAIEDYNEAIRLKPDAETYFNRGFFYEILGQYQRAIEDLNKAINLKPDYAAAYANRGVIYGYQGDNERRCQDLKKACALGECKQLETSKENGFCR